MRYLPGLLIGLLGAGVLMALGFWQVERLAWKQGVLAEIDARIDAEPVDLPDDIDPERDRYLPVQVSGEAGERALHVLVSTREHGAGFRVITGFKTDGGRRILLDQGILPADKKDDPRPPFAGTVIGNLHWPDERDTFTPDNDVEGNYWYAREVDIMAKELGTDAVLLIARELDGPDSGIFPLPVDSSGIPNDHLGYAVTWFGLAAVWLGMTALFLWRISRRTR